MRRRLSNRKITTPKQCNIINRTQSIRIHTCWIPVKIVKKSLWLAFFGTVQKLHIILFTMLMSFFFSLNSTDFTKTILYPDTFIPLAMQNSRRHFINKHGLEQNKVEGISQGRKFWIFLYYWMSSFKSLLYLLNI